MPKGVTTNVQLQQLAKRMHIPYFRSTFMRTTLPTEKVYRNENDPNSTNSATNCFPIQHIRQI